MATSRSLDVVVLAGGISHERDVSLRSGRRVSDALGAAGHRVRFHEPDATLLADLQENRPDVVWPALHGASGEDGALLALLSLAGIPYVGPHAAGARLAWSKPTAKTLVEAAGVRTPAGVTLPTASFRELGASSVLDAVLAAFDAPLVVKPAKGGSAQGVTIVDDAADLPRAMVDAYTYNDVVLVERKVTGVEVAVTVVDAGEGPQALPTVEISPRDGVYSYEARYNAGETRFFTPARIDPEVADEAARVAVSVHATLGLRDMSRVDLIIADDGTPWFLEANVLPGLTETSLAPQAISASGRTPGSLYAQLAENAAQRVDS